MQSNAQNIAGIGDNLPPSDAETLKTKLRDDHAKPLDHAQKLIDAGARIPAVIEDEETAGKAADYIKQVTGCSKNLEALRVNEKEPYLTLGRVVDGFFKTVTDSLAGAKTKAERPLGAWLKKKADDERRAREEVARQERRKQEEEALAAAALERDGQTADAADLLDQAAQTEQVAHKLQQAAEAKPAELTHTRGTSGARAGLRTWWVGEVVDVLNLDLEVLRHHLAPDALQKAVNSFVAAGGRNLKGAKIYEKSEAVVR